MLHSFVCWLRSLDVLAKDQCHFDLDKPTSGLEAPIIQWLFETSTDPEVFFAAAGLVPQVEWPLDLDVSETLHQLYDIYESCVDVQSRIVPSLEKKASVCAMALSHLYCGRALQTYTGHCFLHSEISRSRFRTDFELFSRMSERCKSQDNVFALSARLSYKERWDRDLHPIKYSEPAHEWLSHILPYYFFAGRVDEDVERLAIAVISRLLSPSSPSTQIIANCTFLACIMIGVRFDKKDIVRIDKSSALDLLAKSLWEQFQITLWGNLDGDGIRVRRRVWDLTDVIYRMLELLPQPPSSQVKWNLDLCRKMYSRARTSEQDPLAALRRAQRFMFDIVPKARIRSNDDVKDPTWLWRHHVPLRGNSHLPQDFDWLVDYLEVVDHDMACDILLLMSSMGVSCSSAKKHLFIKRLIACMDSSMPYRLRHHALRAAHSSRKVLTSIDAFDDAGTVLVKFSHAIMSAISPRPGTTPADDDPDGFLNHNRDLCYLGLVFALAGNSIWHSHLVVDRHIDRCISMSKGYDQSSPIMDHHCHLAGILLRIPSEQVSVTSLGSITDEQWWDMIKIAWTKMYSIYCLKDVDTDELLLVLVKGTKKYMQVASKPDLEQLIKEVDDVVGRAKRRESEYTNIGDVKELGTVARDMVRQKFGQ
ncbi:hypothetical protein DEU56DRAFT_981542 [Suillus clintonianus]|uniref:uncharacterized protein n=1 Tax=Suillus clintonianus TaxID=1904413 RepID=UPI001B871B14|nr:uncharacterized protein DEU56DRAFT_981542 [Suillus clintonianus]KAG2133305.1 hypothetical protein DEU56DRAFT_981542 [Suillus clintonianus]